MIDNIRLQNFRSYSDDSFEFETGVNIIVGQNASGKTNLLESILLLCSGKTYRSEYYKLIKYGSEWARIDGWINSEQRALKVKEYNGSISRDFVVDERSYKNIPRKKSAPVVLFEPSGLRLLTDSPALRREFIDDILERTVPNFASINRNYKKVLAQRNHLLKQSFSTDQMFVWNLRLCEFGSVIVRARREFVDDNKAKFNELYNTLTDLGSNKQAGLKYQTKILEKDYTAGLLNRLEKDIAKDRERGFTSSGPHRDDIELYLGGHPLNGVASRGEIRTVLLALKMLELYALEKACGQKPILLLDDVFGELDGSRRHKLTSYLQNYQTFITTTDADVVVGHFLDSCHVILL